jgi:hypothetical protein
MMSFARAVGSAVVTRKAMVTSPEAHLAVDTDGIGAPRMLLCHGGPGLPDDFLRSCVRCWASWRFPAPASTSGVHRSVSLDGKWEVEAYAGDVQAIRVD